MAGMFTKVVELGIPRTRERRERVLGQAEDLQWLTRLRKTRARVWEVK